MVYIIAGAEWHFGVVAVHAAGTGICQMFNIMVPSGFQDVYEPCNVAVDVGIRVFEAVAHTCLGSEVANFVEVFLFKQLHYPVLIGKIDFCKPVVRVLCCFVRAGF